MNAHRFTFDSREDAADERLEILNDREGVWRCRTIFNCAEACPREIRVTKAIRRGEKAVLKGSATSPSTRPPSPSGDGRQIRNDTGPAAKMPWGRCY